MAVAQPLDPHLLPAIRDYIDHAVEQRIVELTAAAFPSIVDADDVRYQIRQTGTGQWRTVTVQQATLARGKGRGMRIVVDYDDLSKVVAQ